MALPFSFRVCRAFFPLRLLVVIVSLWALFGSVVGCAFGAIAYGIGLSIGGNGLEGVAVIGAGIVLAGLSVFLFFGCKAVTRLSVLLTKKIALGIKNCFKKGRIHNE